jgi:uracil phosphoribosyltransferase
VTDTGGRTRPAGVTVLTADARRGESQMDLPSNVTLVDHPLVQHKVTILRDVKTGAKEFRELVSELAMLMAYEATRGFQLAETTVTTPITETQSKVLAGKKVAVVPILRAGLGMVDGILALLPAAKVGHIGLYASCRRTSASATS